ncbi:MAG: acylphosphatase [Ignavibacteria bacterium]|nr:acylphosphatase [Ignavibacteria bacterium]
MKCLKIIVKGMVQGVGFRYFCFEKANELGIYGYAKNLFNGDVEIVAEGDETLLNEFIKAVNIGPRFSDVNSLNINEIQNESRFNSFRIY